MIRSVVGRDITLKISDLVRYEVSRLENPFECKSLISLKCLTKEFHNSYHTSGHTSHSFSQLITG